VPEAPNLEINASGIDFDPVSPAPGDTVTITVEVENSGTVDAEEVVVRVEDATDEDDPVLISEQTITDPVEAKSSATISMTFDTTDLEGDRTIRATADPENAIEESDEEDNSATKTLSFGDGNGGEDEGDEGSGEGDESESTQANLLVTPGSLLVQPANESSGDGQLTVAATIENVGPAPLDDVVVQFMDLNSGQVLNRRTFGSLHAADIVTMRATVNAPASAQIAVVVDPANVIVEANELDNSLSVGVE
jgi:subtilase family serine protease